MSAQVAGKGDSHEARGGVIPDSGGAPAFRLIAPSPSAIPVLIAVPHAGRVYPARLLGALRDSAVLPRLEDRLADRLGQAIASQTGAALLVAEAPRAMIDLNRAEEDVDWTMVAGGQPAPPAPVGGRARSGLGLVPRRLPGSGEMWARPLPRPELEARIAGVHRPYHACVAEVLADLRARWGAALLVDLHSMPPLPRREGVAAARIVLGDRFGASCHGSLMARAFASLAGGHWPIAHNRPYAGGFALDRHGAPRRGLHAMQVEVDRSAYLDSRLLEPGEGMAAVVEALAAMVRALAAEVAMLGASANREWPQAAE